MKWFIRVTLGAEFSSDELLLTSDPHSITLIVISVYSVAFLIILLKSRNKTVFDSRIRVFSHYNSVPIEKTYYLDDRILNKRKIDHIPSLNKSAERNYLFFFEETKFGRTEVRAMGSLAIFSIE